MQFKRDMDIEVYFPGSLICWSAEDAERTYMIIKNTKHPERGYTASWRVRGRMSRAKCMPIAYPSKRKAEEALRAARDRGELT